MIDAGKKKKALGGERYEETGKYSGWMNGMSKSWGPVRRGTVSHVGEWQDLRWVAWAR